MQKTVDSISQEFWLITQVSKPYLATFLGWKYSWLALFVLVLSIAALLSRKRIKQYFGKQQTIRQGWVSYQVEKFKRERIGPKKLLYQRIFDELPYPSRTSLLAAVGIIAIAWFIEWITKKYCYSGIQPVDSLNGNGSLSTLWQVQVSLGAAALPILIFIIELSKDQGNAATRSPEVLIRETWIFPIIVATFSIAAKLGWDMYVNNDFGTISLLNLVLFWLSLFLTIFAYYQGLRLLFSPALLKTKSTKLMKEKIGKSVLFSAEARVGNNWMLKTFEELGIGWYPFSARREERERYHTLDAWQVGRVVNINVELLRAFKDSLDLKPTRPAPRLFGAGDSEGAETETELREERKAIYIAKKFRELVRDRNRTLILIDRTAVNTFDREEAQDWVKKIFLIEAEDEG